MNILANMKIGARLTFGFGVVLALAIVITVTGVWQINAVVSATRAMMELPIAKERQVSDWAENVSVGVTRTTAIARSADPSLASFFANDAAEASKRSLEIIRKLEPNLVSQEEKDLYAKVLENRKSYETGRDEVMKLKSEGRTEEADKLFESTFLPAAQSYQKLLAEFVDAQRKRLDADAARIREIETSSRNQLILLAALVLAFGIFCAWRLTAGITRPLSIALAAARRVADGDLTGKIEAQSKDETGQLLQALKDMNDNLLKIVGQVRTGTDAIATASGQIAAGNLDLSSRTEQQASSLEETASSMEELTSTVKQNADNARQANHLAASASDVAGKGGMVVSRVVDTMSSINESARKIVDIIGVIDGIAFQTNILALNAAVEAARAGEQGRGFAVVATEVRNLAQRSAGAAKEIKALIGDSVEKVDAGSKLVGQAGETMDEIVESVKRVTDIMAEISAATQEQTSGIDQINHAISQMDQVTQQNASLVEEAAAASKAMQDQAGNLAQLVSVFKLDNTQAATAPAVPVTREPVRKLPDPKQAAAHGQPVAREASSKKRPVIAVSRPKPLPPVKTTSDDDWEEF